MEDIKLEVLSDTTEKQLNDIYSDNYIINAFMQDNSQFKPLKHPLVTYYSCYANNIFMGVFLVINYSVNEIEIHSLLKKKAIKYSRKFGNMILKKCFQNDNITRVTALIISDLKKAINYVKKLGFIYEGTKREATSRNNNKLNVDIFGITRKELK